MTQVFNDPYVPPSTDYKEPVISVHGWSHAIEVGLLGRMKAIPPFINAAKFVSSNVRPTQPEHIPFVGVYFMDETLAPLGDLEIGEAKFIAHTKFGISYIIQNNDSDMAAAILSAAYWSFMKMFHFPEWHLFPYPHPQYPDRKMWVDGVSAISHDRLYGNLNNETPIAEMQIEITYKHGFDFEPVPLDKFELFHMETWPWPAQPGEVKPIITEWTLPQN